MEGRFLERVFSSLDAVLDFSLVGLRLDVWTSESDSCICVWAQGICNLSSGKEKSWHVDVLNG